MKIEDIAGRILIIAIFYAALLAKAMKFTATPPSFSAEYAVQILTMAFTALVIFFTIVRLPVLNSAHGIEPRITAILGTFVIVLLNFLPQNEAPHWVISLEFVLVLSGFVGSIFCLCWLGRAFSIMATARKLVTTGPYSVVRHPLYICENLFVGGIVIAHFSAAALLLWAVQIALQFRRMFNEEGVLRETFPEYDEYARRVPMIIPAIGSVVRARFNPGQ